MIGRIDIQRQPVDIRQFPQGRQTAFKFFRRSDVGIGVKQDHPFAFGKQTLNAGRGADRTAAMKQDG